MASNDDRFRSLVLGYLKEAKQNLCRQDYGKSYAFFLLVLKLAPDMRAVVEKDFSAAWQGWSRKLVSLGKFKETVQLYEQGCEMFQECENLHLAMAESFHRMDQKLAAYNTYKRAQQINPENMTTRECIDNLCREMIDNWTYPMLNDKERNFKFNEAICDKITSMKEAGKEVHVLDIGSGTGIMSVFAARNGATTVTACEMSSTMSNLGCEIIQGNGFGNTIVSINCESTHLRIKEPSDSYENPVQNILPQRVSLVISETLDAGVFGEKIIRTIDHAWKELLLPPEKGGSVIPSKVDVKIICVECEEIHQKHCANACLPDSEASNILLTSNVGISWNGDSDGRNVGSNLYTDGSDSEPYTSERISRLKHKLLSDYHIVKEVNLNDPTQVSTIAETRQTIEIKIPIVNDGYLDSVILCFNLSLDDNLVPKYVIRTDIDTECCWEQAVYPIRCIDKVLKTFKFARLFVRQSDVVDLYFTQHHDKLVLENCIHHDNHTHQQICLPQNLLYEHLSIADASVFILGEEKIAIFTDNEFAQSCQDLISKIMKSGSRSGLKKNNDCNSSNLHSSNGLSNAESITIEKSTVARCQNTQSNTQYKILDMTNCYAKLPLLLTQLNSNILIHKADIGGTEKFLSSLNLRNVSHVKNSNEKYDAVVIDIMDQCGLLNQQAVHNIVQAKLCLQHNGLILPSRVRLIGMVFQSKELLHRCSIPSTDQTIGIEIGQYLQKYQATTLSHININTTNFTALSDPLDCMNIDINDEDVSFISSSEANLEVEITQDGLVHGMLVWSIFEMDCDISFNTSDPSNYWLQCAIMFERGAAGFKSVTAGDKLKLRVMRNLSYFTVNLLNSA